MPTNETRAVQVYSASLTTREQREFARAERTIARGLKSFLEVGMALKEIRDKRLYRQHFDTFEQYVATRWEMSRPRAYELCAASEVVEDLSAIADIRVLPENEAQARPLTRLRTSRHRRKAWLLALNLAKAGGRPVTASNVEAAVLKLDGEARSSLVDGVPMSDRSQGIADALAGLEEAVESLAHDQPDKIAALLAEIGKLHSNILQLERHGRPPFKLGDDGEPGFPTDDRYWLTPPELYEALNNKYGPFDYDPCPCPRPKRFNSLIVPWGRRNFVNPPFHPHDGVDGQGPTAFVRKAIAEKRLGKSSVLLLPVQSYVNLLLEAGAELHSLGRVPWRESTTGKPMNGPSPICCFVLRGKQ